MIFCTLNKHANRNTTNDDIPTNYCTRSRNPHRYTIEKIYPTIFYTELEAGTLKATTQPLLCDGDTTVEWTSI
jgi:hypothetical protein